MKRTTSLVTVSLPPQMLKASERLAADKNMTRSELLRMALRRLLDEEEKTFSKLELKQMEREDNKIWKKLEKDFRNIREQVARARYPYLYE